jgi:hypothetical protein
MVVLADEPDQQHHHHHHHYHRHCSAMSMKVSPPCGVCCRWPLSTGGKFLTGKARAST